MTTDTAPADLPAERLDTAVRTATKLCKDFRRVEQRGNQRPRVMGLPDKSALQGLLSFAQSTPSTTEAVLFVRYQATRLTRNKEERFLIRLADELEGNWSTSVEELRRFLGILVRAGVVARTLDPDPVADAGRPASSGSQADRIPRPVDRGAPERSRPRGPRR
jgi:hypothetical protein